MKIISATKAELLLEAGRRKDINWKSFIFDIGIIPIHSQPKRIVIQRKAGRYLQTYEMSWHKFLKKTCIDNMCLIDKSEFVYRSQLINRVPVTSRKADAE